MKLFKLLIAFITLSATFLLFAADADDSDFKNEGFCYDCLEQNYKIFVKMLECKKSQAVGCFGEIVDEVEKKGFLSPIKKRKLKRVGDFYQSRVGVLIHEQCFKKGLFDFDVESAVSETYIKGMVGVLSIFGAADFFDQENGGASYQNHMPGIVREFDRSLWKTNENVGEAYFKKNFKQQVYSQKKACETLKTVGLKVQGEGSEKKCNFHPEIPVMQNKIFCQMDFLTDVGETNLKADPSRNSMSASGVDNKIPAIIQWKGKTEVYSYPYISVKPEQVKGKRGRFMSFLWHENGHVIGQKHNNRGEIETKHYNEHPDYPVFCQIAFFWKEHAKNILTRDDLEYSQEQCISSGKSDATINRRANRYRNLL